MAGAAGSAVTNALDENADHSVGGFAKSMVTGAVVGAATAGAGKLLAPVLSKAAAPLKAGATKLASGAAGKMSSLGRTAVSKLKPSSGSPRALQAGVRAEAKVLAARGVPKKTKVWRPTQEQMDSAAFRVVVGKPKFTPGGKPVGTAVDSPGLEIKAGSSSLSSSYQLRMLTYRSLVENEPLTIATSRPSFPTLRITYTGGESR